MHRRHRPEPPHHAAARQRTATEHSAVAIAAMMRAYDPQTPAAARTQLVDLARRATDAIADLT